MSFTFSIVGVNRRKPEFNPETTHTLKSKGFERGAIEEPFLHSLNVIFKIMLFLCEEHLKIIIKTLV